MPADRLTTVPVLLTLRSSLAKVVLPLEPCPAHTVLTSAQLLTGPPHPTPNQVVGQNRVEQICALTLNPERGPRIGRIPPVVSVLFWCAPVSYGLSRGSVQQGGRGGKNFCIGALVVK